MQEIIVGIVVVVAVVLFVKYIVKGKCCCCKGGSCNTACKDTEGDENPLNKN